MTFVRKAPPLAVATLGYLALTLAYTWPLPRHILHGVAHDAGDPILNAWILWWSTKAVPLTQAWWNAPIFYPAPGTLAFSEHLLGEAPLAWPIIALTGNALFGYNVALIGSYVLCGLGAHWLGYTLTRRHDAAFVAGVAYAFAPYRLAQVPHIQVLSSYYAPVCLAALHRYDRQATARWGAIAAGAWLMQSLANGYFFFFFSVLLLFWFLWFAVGRWPVGALARLGAWFTGAAILLVPALLGYREILSGIYGFSRPLYEIQTFSADVASLLQATDELLLWGWVHAIRRPEGELFPGPSLAALAVFAVLAARPWAGHADTRTRWWLRRIFGAAFILLLAASILPIVYGTWRLTIGGVRLVSIARADKPVTLAMFAGLAWMAMLPRVADAARRRATLAFYAFAAFAMWVFALGPDPTVFDHRALYQAPYGWLMRLSAFSSLRVPARFWMMAVLCLTALAALAIDRLRGRARLIVASLAIAGLALDGWPKQFRVLAEPEHRPAPAGVSMRLDLPSNDDNDAASLYRQTLQPIPLYNGYSGYAVPHMFAMRALLDQYDSRILDALTARGSLGVVIDHSMDEDGKFRRFVGSYPGAALEETHPGWSSYRLPARGGGDLLPDVSGTELPVKTIKAFPSPPHGPRAVDGDLRTRWSGGVQQVAADFTVELEQPQHVGQLVTYLGEFYGDFPTRLRMTVSRDGDAWDTVFEGNTALQAYYAAVRHPKTVPVVYPIDRDGVRFIRLQQIGWGKRDWSIAELRVLR